MSPENLDNLAAECDRTGARNTAAALRAASTSWRRSLADLAEAQRDNSLLQARINRARAQLADPAPEYRDIASMRTVAYPPPGLVATNPIIGQQHTATGARIEERTHQPRSDEE